MSGIKDRVSAALHKNEAGTHGTHGTHDSTLGGSTGHMHTGGVVGSSGSGMGSSGMTGSGMTGTGMPGTGMPGTGMTGTGMTGTGMPGTSMSTTSMAGSTGSGMGMHGGMNIHGTGELVGGSPVVIDTKTFTKTEDHEVLIEKKAYELQHRPVEKEYVVETRYVGEQRVAGAPTELVGTEAREVEERVVQAPSGDRAVVVENVDVPREMLAQEQTYTTSSTHGTSSASGTPGSTGNTTSF